MLERIFEVKKREKFLIIKEEIKILRSERVEGEIVNV